MGPFNESNFTTFVTPTNAPNIVVFVIGTPNSFHAIPVASTIAMRPANFTISRISFADFVVLTISTPSGFKPSATFTRPTSDSSRTTTTSGPR